MRLMHRYIDRVIAVGTVDDVVLDTFIGVVHLVQTAVGTVPPVDPRDGSA